MIRPPPKPKPVIKACKQPDGLFHVWACEDGRRVELEPVRTIEEVVAIILDERGETQDIGERPQAA